MRPLIAATALILIACSASARVTQGELNKYVSGVDINTLSSSQLNMIEMAIHSGDKRSDKVNLVRSIVQE